MNRVFSPPDLGSAASLGLLALRVVAGLALAMHGYPKIQHMTSWMGPDSWAPPVLQALAAIAEFGGGLALALGIFTPLACLGILCVMATAIFAVHVPHGDPFVSAGAGKRGSYELPLLYLASAFSVMLTGPGSCSVDALFFKKKLVTPTTVERRETVSVP